MKFTRILVFAILCVLGLYSSSQAQWREYPQSLLLSEPSNPEANMPLPMPRSLAATPISSRNYIGPEIGLTYTFFQGQQNFFYSYTVSPSPTSSFAHNGAMAFDGLGSGIGLLVGGVIDLSLSDAVGLQGKLRFFTNSSSETEEHEVNVTTPAGIARVNNNYSITTSSVGIDVLLRYQLVQNGPYLLGGLGFASLTGNSFKGSQTIDSSAPGVSFLDAVTGQPSGITSIPINGTNLSDFFNSTREDLKVGVGTFIPTGSSMVIAPELLLSIPLSKYFSNNQENAYSAAGATTPKEWYFALSVGIKFPFGGSSDEMADAGTSSNSTIKAQEDASYHLKGRVTDKRTGKPVDANMTVVDLKSNEVVNTGRTDDDGNYDLKVNGPGRYSVTADANGYLFGSSYFEVDNQGRILRGNHDISLGETSNGRTRLLIFFDFDKADLKPDSYPELTRAARLMKANSSMTVEIAGYTDSKGAPDYNQKLSQRRAAAVVDYLASHGVDRSRLSAKGYGEQDPVATNDTEDGRSENRRVEFVVLSR